MVSAIVDLERVARPTAAVWSGAVSYTSDPHNCLRLFLRSDGLLCMSPTSLFRLQGRAGGTTTLSTSASRPVQWLAPRGGLCCFSPPACSPILPILTRGIEPPTLWFKAIGALPIRLSASTPVMGFSTHNLRLSSFGQHFEKPRTLTRSSKAAALSKFGHTGSTHDGT